MSQGQSISVQGVSGFAGSVTISLQNLPAGVTSSPSGGFTLAAGQSQYISFSASSAAATGSFTITVAGTSGSLNHSATFTVVVSAAAPFQINLSPSSLNMQPGSQATVTVTAIPTSGSLPSDLNFNVPPQLGNTGMDIEEQGLTSTSTQFTITISATAAAQPVQNYPVLVSAADGATGESSQSTLLITVGSPFPPITAPTRSTFFRTEMGITGAAYDATRKLVFATAWQLNEVLVLSAVDGSLKATIPVTEAFGIDETADGSKVYVGSLSANITVIDPNLLQVTQVIYNLLPPVQAFTNDASIPLTLSNGKVLIVGPSIYLWDPVAGTLTNSDIGNFGAFGNSSRSADHSKALVSEGDEGTRVLLYDANTDSFSVFTTSDNNTYLNSAVVNANGSQIAAASADGQGVSFYNSQMQLQATIPIAAGLNGGPALIYSHDGTHLYALCSLEGLPAATVIDTATYTLAGVVPDPILGIMRPFAIDETGMIFNATDQGLGFVDVSNPGSVQFPFPLFNGGVSPVSLSLSSPTPVSVNGSSFSASDRYQVFFGAAPASLLTQAGSAPVFASTTSLQTTVPAGIQPGPVNVTITRSDGWAQIAPNAATFGPQIMMLDGTAGPSKGGSTIVIYGYGLDASTAQVTIGGAAATVSQYIAPGAGSPGPPLDVLYVTTPAGAPGPADVTVSTPSGSATLSQGFQYLSSADVYPKAGELSDILYDQARQLLYVSNTDHNEVEVFSLTAKSFSSPIVVGNNPLGLAMTPDGSTLAVVNSGDGTVSLVNLNSGTTTEVYPVLTSADKGSQCQGVVYEATPAGTQGMIVAVDCTYLEENGTLHFLNLSNGSLDCSSIPACDPGSNNINLDFQPKMLASSPDASLVMLADTIVPGAQGGGGLSLINMNTKSVVQGGQSDGDGSVDADGNLIAGGFAIYDPQLENIALPQDIGYLDAAGLSPGTVIGEKLNPSGSLLFVPQQTIFAPTRGMDVFDVHRQRLAMRIALPDSIPGGAMSSLALDETGTKMFIVSSSGITVAQLQASPLSIGSVNPADGPVGTQVTIRGSGFTSSSKVTFGTAAVSSSFVDQNTLKATIPSLSPGAVRVTVSNPQSVSYSFDAAFVVQ
jgi:WD40 repeat protein